MDETVTIQCPFCGQEFELMIDATISSQRFVADCEICCRPLQVTAECEGGDLVSLNVDPG